MWIFSGWRAIIVIVLAIVGRRQAVRHWVLVPAFAGSNPAVPAKFDRNKLSLFWAIFCFLSNQAVFI